MEDDGIKNFESTIIRLAPWIKEKIGESEDKCIRVIDIDFLGDIDIRLIDKAKKDPTSLYHQTKDILSKEGIWVTLGSTKTGDTVYIMRLLSDKREFLMAQVREAESEISKLKEYIQTSSIDQLPDDLIEYLGDNVFI